MNRLIVVLAIAFSIVSCSDTRTNQQEARETIAEADTPASSATESTVQTPPNQQANTSVLNEGDLKRHIVTSIPANDFTLITEKAGIFISPDTVEIERLKQEYGEEDFYTAADDNLYYEYEADKHLEQKGIKTIYPKTRYLKFKTSSGKEYFFDTKPESGPNWYLMLFDPSKNYPVIISTIDIVEEHNKYFGNK